MRMRAKKNAPERLERAGTLLITDGAAYRGRWLQEAFDRPCERLEIEIGCGKGKFALAKALQNPTVGYVAIECSRDVLISALEAAMAVEVGNLRFMNFDARLIEEVFAPGEVGCVYLNFSDPWPKSGYRKRRLTSPEFLARYECILPQDGQVAFKTDNSPFFEDSVGYFAASGYELLRLTRDLHHSDFAGENIPTEYEELFSAQGKPINYLLARMGERKSPDGEANDSHH